MSFLTTLNSHPQFSGYIFKVSQYHFASLVFCFDFQNQRKSLHPVNSSTAKQITKHTNKTPSRPLPHIHHLKMLLKTAVVCYRHQFSLPQPLKLAFIKHQKSNMQALRRSIFANYSMGYAPPRPFASCVRLLKPTM